MSKSGLRIRAMTDQDIPAIVALEKECRLSSWGLKGYQQELINSSAFVLVARQHDQVVGYLSGRTMADEFELLSLGVAPDFRRQGIARQLMNEGMQVLRSQGISRWFLEVRAANLSAQQLYLSCGFSPVGRRRNYYTDPLEDAVIMAYEVNTLTGSTE